MGRDRAEGQLRTRARSALLLGATTLGWLAAAGEGHAATVLYSDSWDRICRVQITVGNGDDGGSNASIHDGPIVRGFQTTVHPRQGNHACYRRSRNPSDCGSGWTEWRCTAVTDWDGDRFEIR
jgi:hypothetical protein